ncbi:MAG TPA: 50S ribosomal protein L5 [Erysipelotrichaceae bacterium]|nr:50S ribosomal protein L5 [Erysipelotrichaceae bacterium]
MAEEIKKETKTPAKKATPKKTAAPKAEAKAEKVKKPKAEPKVEKEKTPKAEVKAEKAKTPKAEAKTEKAKAPKAEVKVEKPKEAKAEKKVEKEKAPEVEAKVEKPKAEKVSKGSKQAAVVSRLQAKYKNEVCAKLLEKYGYRSPMQIPALNKIVINVGVGDGAHDSKKLDQAVNELSMLSGQKPIITKAKKSIASFKLRAGQEIGCKVTLRGLRMYEFFDKLVSIALPRVRDFRGVSKNAFDGRGNYTLGIKEQLIFPEIDYDKVVKVRGMDIVIVTTAKTDAEAYTLLQLLGMPFHH